MKKTTKITLITTGVATLAIACIFVGVLANGKQDDVSACQHDYAMTVTQAATCAQAGEKTYTCNKCGEERKEEIGKLPHTEQTIEGIEATCEGYGWTAGKQCVECKEVLTPQLLIPALGHSLELYEAKAATCLSVGWNKYEVCQRTGCTYTTYEEIAELGHDYDVNDVCKRCDYVKPPNHVHSYDIITVTQATCEEDGEKTYTCLCGEKRKETILAVGHNWDMGRITKKASCGVQGERTYTCANCNGERIEYLTALQHSYTSKVTTEATCTTSGIRTYTCSNCFGYYEEMIAALGHSYDNGKITVQVGCETNGVKTYTCGNCGDTYTNTIPARGHSYDNGTETATLTCTTDGKTVYHCNSCGKNKEETKTAMGHTWSNGVCSVCDDSILIGELTTIRGAQLSVVKEERPIIGFGISVDEGYAETLSENQEIGAYVMEYEKVKVLANKSSTTDWASMVEGVFVAVNEKCTRVEFRNIPYEKINTQYVAVHVVKTTLPSGKAIYQYASNAYTDVVKDGVGARSVAYLASCTLNDEAMNGGAASEETINGCKKYIDESADLARGLSAPVYDGSTYKVVGHTKVGDNSYFLTFENGIYEGIAIWLGTGRFYASDYLTLDLTGAQTVTLYMAGNAYDITVE